MHLVTNNAARNVGSSIDCSSRAATSSGVVVGDVIAAHGPSTVSPPDVGELMSTHAHKEII